MVTSMAKVAITTDFCAKLRELERRPRGAFFSPRLSQAAPPSGCFEKNMGIWSSS